jgi:hypothetical protein
MIHFFTKHNQTKSKHEAGPISKHIHDAQVFSHLRHYWSTIGSLSVHHQVTIGLTITDITIAPISQF